jgi:ferredoxin
VLPVRFSTSSLIVIGFLIMAACSTVLTFKQARVLDAMGDVGSLKAEIQELRTEMEESGTDEKEKTNIKEKIEKIEKEKMPDQRQDVIEAMASLPNGAIIWTLLSSVGTAIFGLGIISIFLKEEENPIVRSTALLLIGGIALACIAARFAYIIIAGGSDAGASF